MENRRMLDTEDAVVFGTEGRPGSSGVPNTAAPDMIPRRNPDYMVSEFTCERLLRRSEKEIRKLATVSVHLLP
jgi:hypothetical protein